MLKSRTSPAVLALALFFGTVPAATADSPTAVVVAELPGLPGYPDHHVTGINDLGQVVGSAQGSGPAHAVLWSPRGGATDLGPGLASAINQRGQVLGLETRETSPPYSHKSWIWFDGKRTAIAPPGAAWTLGQAINESGAVPVVYSVSSSGEQHDRAAVWEDGRSTELPMSGPDVWPYGISDAGVVVGGLVSPSGDFSAIRCAEGACTRLADAPGYGVHVPEAINESGVVVGNRGTVALRWEGDAVTVLSDTGRVAHGAQSLNERGDAVGWSADPNGSGHAVLWPAGGKSVVLGVPAPSEAVAVNERGDVVGWAATPDYSTVRAFLWRAGQVTYLDSVGGSWSVPVAINNHGVVVGESTGADGTTKAVRWTPVTTTPIR